MPDLIAIIDTLTVRYHEARRRNIHEWSGAIGRDLRELRAEVNAIRHSVGLGPSPVEEDYPGQEED